MTKPFTPRPHGAEQLIQTLTKYVAKYGNGPVFYAAEMCQAINGTQQFASVVNVIVVKLQGWPWRACYILTPKAMPKKLLKSREEAHKVFAAFELPKVKPLAKVVQLKT